MPLIVVSVVAAVVIIIAVIQLIMLMKQRADIKRSYFLLCTEFDVACHVV